MLKTTEDQMISMQVWRNPHERIGINTLSERLEEAVGVHAKDDCLTPVGIRKYIPNREITGEVLIEIIDNTIPRLLLPQSVTETSNETNSCIGGASVGDTEKAGWKADSVQSVENRKFYKT